MPWGRNCRSTSRAALTRGLAPPAAEKRRGRVPCDPRRAPSGVPTPRRGSLLAGGVGRRVAPTYAPPADRPPSGVQLPLELVPGQLLMTPTPVAPWHLATPL